MSPLAIKGGTPVRTQPFPEYPVFGDEEVEAAARVIRSGKLCSQMGHETEQFEKEYAAYHDIPFATAVSSGTTALHTALAVAGIGVGDEVIVPPYTFLATATSVLMHNAIPVFADIEPQTLGLDAGCVEKKISRRTKGVIIVHMNGYPAAHLTKIQELCRKKKLVLIEDCSHAHGGEFKGRKLGTLGDIGIFSFQQKKNLSLGEGGILITSDQTMDHLAKGFRSFGGLPLGFNYRMTEIHAAIGRVRLKRLDKENETRNQNADFLAAKMSGIPGLQIQRPMPGTKAVYYNLVVRYDEKILKLPRKDFMKAVQAEGIPLPGIYYPLYRDRVFRERNAYNRGCPFTCPYYQTEAGEQPDYRDGSCPVTEETCDRKNIEIKIHPPGTVADMNDIADAFAKVVDGINQLH